ncbi:MAG: family 43 glycosylhydrolase [Treponema sp.]|jgi:arabinoxylan arabinofuranohydrolase|nr:family 43 glycosylhydrolase [Treponema sp.]
MKWNNKFAISRMAFVCLSATLMSAVVLALLAGCGGGETSSDDITVTFDLGYSGAQNTPKPVTIAKDGTLGDKLPPDPPDHDGYTFMGWYSGGVEYTEQTAIAKSIKLTAEWVEIPNEAALFANLTLGTPLKDYGDVNPICLQRFGADPWGLVYQDRVYVYMTGDTFRLTSGTSPAPDFSNLQANDYSNINTIRVVSSSDLVNWTEHPEIRAAGSQGAATGATNSWAPAAAYKNIDGTEYFFLYFADNANGIFVLRAESPLGPFTNPRSGGSALINRSSPNCSTVTWLFDPAVLIDDDGKAYIYFGGGVPSGGNASQFTSNDPLPGTERAVQLGDDMISIVGTPQPLKAHFIYEDSGINKIGGIYYYSYVSNFQVHHYLERPEDFPAAVTIGKSGAITYMTSDSPLGPYTLQKMILPNPDEMFQQHGAGANNHHAMFEFRGKYYIVYHSRLLEMAMGVPGTIPREGYRSAHIDEVTLKPDGTINEIEGSRKGAAQSGRFNPFELTSAATIGNQAGITTVAVTGEQRMKVTSIDSGDWIALYGVDFGAGAGKFKCRVTPPTDKGVIQIRQDGLKGRAIGYVNVEPGQPEITADLLRTVTGVHDLVFIFYSEGGQSGQGFEFEQWQFIR